MPFPSIAFITPATTGSSTDRHLSELEQSLQQTQAPHEWILQWDEDTIPANTCGGNHGCNGKRLGTSATRNFALLRTTAGIIRGVDQDDLIPKGSAEEVLQVFSNHPEINYVIGPALDFEDRRGSPKIAFPYRLNPGIIPVNQPFELWDQAGGIADVPAISLYIRRHTLLQHGGWPALPGSEDTLLWLALAQKEPGWFLKTPLTHYRKHSCQVTRSAWNQNSKPMRKAYIRMLLTPNP